VQALLDDEIKRLSARASTESNQVTTRTTVGNAGIVRYRTGPGAQAGPDAAHGVVVVGGQALRLDSRATTP
jgi:hypothetical protein